MLVDSGGFRAAIDLALGAISHENLERAVLAERVFPIALLRPSLKLRERSTAQHSVEAIARYDAGRESAASSRRLKKSWTRPAHAKH